jgi:hypothetical protein
MAPFDIFAALFGLLQALPCHLCARHSLLVPVQLISTQLSSRYWIFQRMWSSQWSTGCELTARPSVGETTDHTTLRIVLETCSCLGTLSFSQASQKRTLEQGAWDFAWDFNASNHSPNMMWTYRVRTSPLRG